MNSKRFKDKIEKKKEIEIKYRRFEVDEKKNNWNHYHNYSIEISKAIFPSFKKLNRLIR